MLYFIESTIEVLKDKETREFMFKTLWLIIIGILTDNAYYSMKAKCNVEAFIDKKTSEFKEQLTSITEKEGYYEIK